jgi:hypothetical protein
MTEVTVSDALGNEVTIKTDASLDVASRTAKRLFDHIAAEPATKGPATAGQTIGFGLQRPGVAYFREGDPLEVKA